jgi:hypothetical protein
MSKRETIDRIRQFNPSAQADFLATFDQMDLLAYLHQLQELDRERRSPGPEAMAERLVLVEV